MQLFTIITSLLAGAVSVRAAIGGVEICEGPYATGVCNYTVYALDTCYDLPTGLVSNAATFSPDGDAFTCYPHVGSCSDICTSPEGCTYGPISFYDPVKYNLTAVNWNTLIQSLRCSANTTTTATKKSRSYVA